MVIEDSDETQDRSVTELSTSTADRSGIGCGSSQILKDNNEKSDDENSGTGMETCRHEIEI